MKKYYIHTYGCQMNVHESEKLAGIVQGLGYEETAEETNADIIMFNTCCIRDTAESKILGHIGETKILKKNNPKLIVVVCGCMSQQDNAAEKLKNRFPHLDIILGTHNISELASRVNELKHKKNIVAITNNDAIVEDVPVYRTSGTNAWVNIIYGCNNFCTYCIVPYVRGREHSRPMELIIADVKQLVSDGYKEITLLGQNVNSYGKDLGTTNFAILLQSLANIEGDFLIRFMTSHPKDFSDDVIDVISKNSKICKHIHLPVQSGSTKVLAMMNRKYTKEDYLLLVEKIRHKIPNVGITSDIMVGFPEETEEDFLETLDLVNKARFSALFSFIYSKRKGTVAYDMPQIDRATKSERIGRMINMQSKITSEESQKYINNIFKVLVESYNKSKKLFSGRTSCGRLVNLESESDIMGQFVNVKIYKAKAATLWGKIVEEN